MRTPGSASWPPSGCGVPRRATTTPPHDHPGGQAREGGADQALDQLVAPGRAPVGGVQEQCEQRQADDRGVLLERGEPADLAEADDRVHADVAAQQHVAEGRREADDGLGEGEHPAP